MPSLNLTADASTVVNLINSGRAPECLSNLTSITRLTPQVQRETNSSTVTGVGTAMLMAGGLLEVEPAIVSFSDLEELIFSSSLGAGECETILSCAITGRTVCCDDRKARKLAKEKLGEDRLTGSLGLLKHQVMSGGLSLEEAFEAYQQMISLGGFLPRMEMSAFARLITCS